MNAKELIRLLGLVPLEPEGGHFRETYRSARFLASLGPGPDGEEKRSLCTAIYFLLTQDTFSALHRLPGDEIYHFYAGDPVELLILHVDGRKEAVTLGPDPSRGMTFQTVVPGGSWQGARLAPGGEFALMGTTMAPGFDSRDLVLVPAEGSERGALLEGYPACRGEILALLPGDEGEHGISRSD